MTAGPLKIAIVGMGLWGARAHFPAFSGRADVDVVALVDPVEEVARGLADERASAPGLSGRRCPVR